jgi:hypothetical protein
MTTTTEPRMMTGNQRDKIGEMLIDLAELDPDKAQTITTWLAEPGRMDRLTAAQASDIMNRIIGALRDARTAQQGTEPQPAAAPRRTGGGRYDAIADGNYALDRGNDVVDFYRVARREGKGKWAGRVFVNVQQRRGGTLTRLEGREATHTVLDAILAAGPTESAWLFSDKLHYCHVCYTPLTDPLSRQRRIGPDCWRDGKGYRS